MRACAFNLYDERISDGAALVLVPIDYERHYQTNTIVTRHREVGAKNSGQAPYSDAFKR